MTMPHRRRLPATLAVLTLIAAGLGAVIGVTRANDAEVVSADPPAGARPTASRAAAPAASTDKSTDTSTARSATGSTSAPKPVLAAMRRDLHLTTAQVIARLAKERRAAETADRLAGELGDSYAGSYLTGDSGTLVVAITDPAAGARVTAGSAEPLVVRRPLSRLTTVKSALDSRAENARVDGVHSWHVDIPGNRVVVEADSLAAGRSFVAAAGLSASDVAVEVSTETPRLLADVRGGDPFYSGNAMCSVGFSVTGGFVTAGHCGRAGASTSGVNRAAQGQFKASSFPGTDYAFVQVNPSWVPRPWVKGASGDNVLVAGSAEALVGASVCRSGVRTGWRCGVITAKNSTVRYPEGTVSGLTRTTACAEPGDSGGAWISGNQAQGITSGGNGNCTFGGTTYFQPINPALRAYGLTLTTTGAPAPSNPVPSNPAPSTSAPSNPAPTNPAPSNPVPSNPAPSNPVPSNPVPSNPVPSNPVPSNPLPSNPVPSTPTPTAVPTLGNCASAATGYAGTIDDGAVLVFPAGTVTGRTQRLCLTITGNAAVRLEVQRQGAGGWAVSTGYTLGRGQTTLTYRGPDGPYRYVLRTVSTSASARYVLRIA